MKKMLAAENARKRILKQGWLGSIPAVAARDFLNVCEFYEVSANEVLFSAGELSNGLWGLSQGAIRLQLLYPVTQGDVQFMAVGSWYGQSAILTGRPHTLTCSVTQSSVVAYISTENLLALLMKSPEYWRWIGCLSVDHLTNAVQGLSDLLIRDPDLRVIAVLLRLLQQRSPNTDLDDIREILISQEDLAEIATLSRTAIGPKLRGLEDEGLIKLSYRKIEILDKDELKRRLVEGRDVLYRDPQI